MVKTTTVAIIATLFIIAMFNISFKRKNITVAINASSKIHYLALGDSYTIGQSVPYNQNFPSQLVQQLQQKGVNINQPEIIGQTGFTTANLLQILQINPPKLVKYNIVTLLIGVNNQYQALPIKQYKIEFTELLKKAIMYAGSAKGVIVLSIPDYAVTPFAQGSDIKSIATQINQFNQAQIAIAKANNVTFLDVTAISRQGKYNNNLQAADGLHPSAEQYTLWVNTLLPLALQAIKTNT